MSMDMDKFLLAMLQFLILLPGTVSCYLPARNRMKLSRVKTAALCMTVILLYSVTAASLCALFSIDVNVILLPSLVIFFFLYRCTVDMDLSCALAIYVGVCAVETFPAQFAYAFDATLHPLSGAAELSLEAALFQLGLSVLLLAAFAYPATHYFQRAVDSPGFSKIWYFTVVLSSIFLIFNVIAVPQSYSTLHAGRMQWIFPVFEAGAFAVLVAIYVLFYRAIVIILEYAELKERTRLFEMQSTSTALCRSICARQHGCDTIFVIPYACLPPLRKKTIPRASGRILRNMRSASRRMGRWTIVPTPR